MRASRSIDIPDPNSLWLDPDRHERVEIPPSPPPELDPQTRLKTFDMVFIGYGEDQAIGEATRCIHCPSPEPCITACPVHNNIPAALLQIEDKNYDEAANIFRLTNTLPEVCGRLCPQEILCEGSCTVAGYDRAVNIGKLENFCTNWQRTHGGVPAPLLPPASGRRVAVVGSGPAGLAAAEQLTSKGHSVVVYEQWAKPGGLLKYGIPDFKLAKTIVADKIAYLERLGVTFTCNTRVGRDIQVDDLPKQFDAVFLGIGTPIGHAINLPGDNLKGVYQATEFLVRGNLPPEELPEEWRGLPEIGKRIAVIGGGDTSADCVRTARRLQVQQGIPDGEVVAYYRGNEVEMSVRDEEFEHALQEGVRYEYLQSPVRFIGDDQGHVRSIELERMRSKADGRQRKRVPLRVPIPGSNFTVPADIVVLAIGYGGDPLIASQTPTLTTTKPGLFQVRSERNPQTTMPGVFAGGDDVHGADLIVTAVAAGRQAAQAMDEYLATLPPKS